jgi:predicted MFS family arabinose efflux permease
MRGVPSFTGALFLCLFAAQSAVIVMAPVLADAASDLDVSTATAGQLRTITGLVAGATALAMGAVSRRLSLPRQLIAGAALLAVGSTASALAGSYAALALAQVPVGAAVAVLTTAAVVAAAEWSTPETRTAVLSWALNGQPAAWIVGMPLLGVLGERSWRLGWLALPLAAALLAGIFISQRVAATPSAQPISARATLRDPSLRRWVVSELLANAGWAGTLVYAGALFAETYDVAPELTGVLLATGAIAYVTGNVLSRRIAREPSARTLAILATALAVSVGSFGVARTSVATSTVLFSVAAFCAGSRTLVASAFGLAVAPSLRASLTSLRAATMQFGYFLGSIAGGAALAARGYDAVGLTMGVLFLLAAATLLLRRPASLPARARLTPA